MKDFDNDQWWIQMEPNGRVATDFFQIVLLKNSCSQELL